MYILKEPTHESWKTQASGRTPFEVNTNYSFSFSIAVLPSFLLPFVLCVWIGWGWSGWGDYSSDQYCRAVGSSVNKMASVDGPSMTSTPIKQTEMAGKSRIFEPRHQVPSNSCIRPSRCKKADCLIFLICIAPNVKPAFCCHYITVFIMRICKNSAEAVKLRMPCLLSCKVLYSNTLQSAYPRMSCFSSILLL